MGLNFSLPVEATGNPMLAIEVGGQTRQASLSDWWRDALWFRYAVQSADRDEDGISIAAGALNLNGGSNPQRGRNGRRSRSRRPRRRQRRGPQSRRQQGEPSRGARPIGPQPPAGRPGLRRGARRSAWGSASRYRWK